ncbi:hypothetical protein [Amycolatopsis albispora]|uniref:Uncharacterized protein n=1 Tax=Amycolatopsis albispora TaxID=1804986 RepID=A0A344LFY7_9PSEU|nr:hypothetical protein [Amycolatopsis albispora]AXB46961.1 hypothetical protein A4R43_34690 [Amycolatopsis albispora]
MGANAEIRKIVARRLTPVLGDLELVVHRFGYLRTLSGAITVLTVSGVLGQVLGVTWLRVFFATAAAVLFVLAGLISFAGTEKLRSRKAIAEGLLHKYADALRNDSPLAIRAWHQEVVIETNGDAHVTRKLVLESAPDELPRYISVNMVYYGNDELTERRRRQVVCTALHAGPEDTSTGTRATATSAWGLSSNGKPKLEVYVHLGDVVEAGDLITVGWQWPKFSADLMNGHAPESFDVLFTKKVGRFEHRVVFRDAGRGQRMKIVNRGASNLDKQRVGHDLVVTFSAVDPELGKRFGFVADYSAE